MKISYIDQIYNFYIIIFIKNDYILNIFYTIVKYC